LLISDVSSCAVPTTASIRDVAQSLTRSGLRLCLVLNERDELAGIVSDGDIRRGLLDGKGLDDSASDVMNRSYFAVSLPYSILELRSLAREKQVSHIPMVDGHGKVTGLFIDQFDEAIPLRSNTVVVMAGGLGMRLRPLTDSTPKPMIPIAGKPMVQHTLEALRSEGFRTFVFALNYLGEQIEQYFGDGSSFGLDISYVKEREPLGTAGALSLLEETFSDPIVVLNGDVLLSANISSMVDYHNSCEADITVGVKVLDTEIPFGVVNLEGNKITRITEKPVYRDFINVGVYVLAPQVLKELRPAERIDMPDVLLKRISVNGVVAFPLHEGWRDVGKPEDLEKARRYYEGNGE